MYVCSLSPLGVFTSSDGKTCLKQKATRYVSEEFPCVIRGVSLLAIMQPINVNCSVLPLTVDLKNNNFQPYKK